VATYSRPGVFLQEVALPQNITLADNGTAVGALVGTLPQGPVVPTLITSWPQFVKTYGSYDNSYPTSFAAYSFFANGGRNVYVNRVVANGATNSSVTLTDSAGTPANSLQVIAVSPGMWGNDLAVEVKAGVNNRFSLVVYGAPLTSVSAADSNVLEQFNDLTMDKNDPRYVVPTINTLSSFVRVADLSSDHEFPDNTPLAAGLKALTSGTNGSAPVRADYAGSLAEFDTISSPLVINLPDVAFMYHASDASAAAELALVNNVTSDLMTYCETRGDAFAVIDTPSNMTASQALTFTTNVATAAAAGATGANAAVYYPWLVVPDPLRSVPGATRTLPPGAAVLGQFLATDASRGVFKAPAGLSNRVALAVATERNLSNADLDSLNAAVHPVNVIRVVPGSGIVVMGARTLKNAPGDRYINVRRSVIHVKKELQNLTAFAMFENNDSRLWSQIRTSIGTFLAAYWSQGGLRGASQAEAYYIRCDETNNTAADIVNGRVNIEVGIAVEYPAEFVVITIGQVTGSASV
jgi:hypothetical protein